MPLQRLIQMSLLATIAVSSSGFVTPIIGANPTPGSTPTPTTRHMPDLASTARRYPRLSRQLTQHQQQQQQQQQAQQSTTRTFMLTSTDEANGILAQRARRQRRRKLPNDAKHPNQNLLPRQRQRQRQRQHQHQHQPEQLQVHDWNDGYEQLRAFYERHDHLRLPRITPAQQALHDWLQTQAREPDRLTDVQLTKLVELGVWTEHLHVQPWEYWYLQLFHFYIHHGHSNVPCSSTTYLLAQWAYCQRNPSLQTHRQKKLLWSINFLWDSRQADFEIHFQRLLDLQQQQHQQQQHASQSIGSVRQWKKMQTAVRLPQNGTTQPPAVKTTNNILNTPTSTPPSTTAATTAATAAASAAATMVLTDETIWQLELPMLFSPTYHEQHQDQQSQNIGLLA